MKTVQLGDILRQEAEEVAVDPSSLYQMAGVRSFGRGLFDKGTVAGTSTSYSRLFKIRAGQIVMSQLFAWEGAITPVEAPFDGRFVSPEFPTFTVDASLADARYVGHFVRWAGFHDALGGATRGLGQRRKRVHPREMLALGIPLPPIDEQRLAADGLDAVSAVTSKLQVAQQRAEDLAAKYYDASTSEIFINCGRAGWPTRSIGDIADVNPAPARIAGPIEFIPMAAVDANHGSVTAPELKNRDDVGTGYKQFRRGDVIFARITPCMQNGKCAVYNGSTEYAYGSTEFHVIRASSTVIPEYLHAFMRTTEFRRAAASRFTGTAGQQRVPADFIQHAELPVPDLATQQAVVQIAQQLKSEQLLLSKRHETQSRAGRALLASAMNAVFAENSSTR